MCKHLWSANRNVKKSVGVVPWMHSPVMCLAGFAEWVPGWVLGSQCFRKCLPIGIIKVAICYNSDRKNAFILKDLKENSMSLVKIHAAKGHDFLCSHPSPLVKRDMICIHPSMG